MARGRRTRGTSALLAVVAAAAAFPAPGAAQGGGDGYLFRRPVVSVGLRTGYTLPRAGSDIFDFTREQLTVDKSDFNQPYLGGEIAIRAGDRVDLVLGLGRATSETRSEFRDWVDTDDLPIEQTTRFVTTPLTVSGRYYLSDRGRRIGRFAWVPTRVNPYLGAGAGWVWYTFEQIGDFVDFETLDIFNDWFQSDGRATTVHAMGGVDLSVSKYFVLSGEARYQWGSGPLDGEFVGFEDMDLAGLVFTVGISARF